MATTKKISGYRIDFTTDTLIMNYKFYAASQQYGSPEYNLVKSITKDFPNLTVSVQAGREVTTANKNKRMTYENMKKHIEAYENSADLLDVFETVKALSKPLANPHKFVADWFRAQFPDYAAVPTFKDNSAKVIPSTLMCFMTQRRTMRLPSKKRSEQKRANISGQICPFSTARYPRLRIGTNTKSTKLQKQLLCPRF